MSRFFDPKLLKMRNRLARLVVCWVISLVIDVLDFCCFEWNRDYQNFSGLWSPINAAIFFRLWRLIGLTHRIESNWSKSLDILELFLLTHIAVPLNVRADDEHASVLALQTGLRPQVMALVERVFSWDHEHWKARIERLFAYDVSMLKSHPSFDVRPGQRHTIDTPRLKLNGLFSLLESQVSIVWFLSFN